MVEILTGLSELLIRNCNGKWPEHINVTNRKIRNYGGYDTRIF